LTDASIGAYTLGVAALIAGKAGLQTSQMAHAALIAISFGLLLAAPTAITGLFDWLDLPKGIPARTTATIHLIVMVTATVLFALTWLAQRPGYNDDEIRTLGLVLGIVAEAFLAMGGNIGVANVFVYGIRVLKRPDTPVAKALDPLGLPAQDAPPQARTMPEDRVHEPLGAPCAVQRRRTPCLTGVLRWRTRTETGDATIFRESRCRGMATKLDVLLLHRAGPARQQLQQRHEDALAKDRTIARSSQSRPTRRPARGCAAEPRYAAISPGVVPGSRSLRPVSVGRARRRRPRGLHQRSDQSLTRPVGPPVALAAGVAAQRHVTRRRCPRGRRRMCAGARLPGG
jgi:uncharacterized membrane protein